MKGTPLDYSKEKVLCESCNLQKIQKIQKIGVTRKRLMKGFSNLCPECVEDLKWTNKCLEIGTDFLVDKLPEKYVKFSKYSVTALV